MHGFRLQSLLKYLDDFGLPHSSLLSARAKRSEALADRFEGRPLGPASAFPPTASYLSAQTALKARRIYAEREKTAVRPLPPWDV